MNSAVIEAEGIVKCFGPTQALGGVDLAAEGGTVLAWFYRNRDSGSDPRRTPSPTQHL
jgi:hypothetical protein